ncbi:MAG TPA: DnaJ domain-containing protein, partial [Candidatus Limnocylindrales bacterium]|nr:DnaJ domain-containing protein [Candidatus Limnocylindrales bacterium]
MAKRDPHEVLGVARGAGPAEIKAAWRKLARAHHPDLTGDDPAASRVATRQMAEINEAYAALTRGFERNGTTSGPPADMGDGPRRRGGAPSPRPSRPVTGRVDTTSTYRPRNTTTPRPPGGEYPARGAGQPPLRA